MTRAEKGAVIEALAQQFQVSEYFYVADSSTMPVSDINDLRRLCFEKGVKIQVAKNTLIKKALDKVEGREYSEHILDVLKGPTTLLFLDEANAENPNLPAKVLLEYRGKTKELPVLKAAYIGSDVFVGDDQLKTLSELRSKADLIGEVVTLLQSPAKNVISALKSSGGTLLALLETLEKRGEEEA
ncbi:MAG: 50S ribosomal protein L10 [Chitinophagales bacterium]